MQKGTAMPAMTTLRYAVATVLTLAAAGSVPGSAQTGAAPTDPQIAHIAYTAGDIDIKNARLALEKSRNRDVRTFADDMVRDHAAVNDKALALVKKLNVTPEDNPTSQGLVKQQDTERTKMASLNGPAFDKAYVANEFASHGMVNAALETTLIPASHNAELKGLLQSGLRIFQEHQKHAQQLAASLK
jgi:putative membrane protein